MCAQSWRLGGLTLQVREGDLFEVPAMAIVSSEQTNFVLSWEESAISGQIRERLDPSIQTELDEQTCGKVLPAGTVLVTHGGPLFEQIYHAGFHEPWVWLETDLDDALETDRDDAEAEHVRTIRQCISIILQRLKQVRE